MATTDTVLPGQGWMLSTVRPGDSVEHAPLVGWFWIGAQLGLAPLVVLDGATTAMVLRSPFDGGQMLWHPDQLSREQVEQRLLAQAQAQEGER